MRFRQENKGQGILKTKEHKNKKLGALKTPSLLFLCSYVFKISHILLSNPLHDKHQFCSSYFSDTSVIDK